MGPLLKQLVLESLTMPKTAARRLLNISLSSSEMFQLAVIVAIFLVLSLHAVLWSYKTLELLDGLEVGDANPIVSVVLQVAQIYFWAICVDRIGRAFGGTGTLDGAILASIFLTFVNAIWLVAIAIMVHISSPLAAFLVLAFCYWTFWALASFVAVLHGFKSVLSTLVGVIVFGLLIMFILLIVFSIVLNATGAVPTRVV